MAALARAYRSALALAGFLSVVSIAAMAVLIAADVSLRYSGAGSLGFALEAVEYCIFLSAFLAAPWILAQNGHVTVDVFVNALPRRVARLADMLANAVGALTTAAILLYVFRVGLDSWSQGMRVIKSFSFPEWWLYVVVAFSLGLVLIEFLARLWRAAADRRGARALPSL